MKTDTFSMVGHKWRRCIQNGSFQATVLCRISFPIEALRFARWVCQCFVAIQLDKRRHDCGVSLHLKRRQCRKAPYVAQLWEIALVEPLI